MGRRTENPEFVVEERRQGNKYLRKNPYDVLAPIFIKMMI